MSTLSDALRRRTPNQPSSQVLLLVSHAELHLYGQSRIDRLLVPDVCLGCVIPAS